MLDCTEPLAGGMAQLSNVILTGSVASLHFMRGGESVLYGSVTLAIFCLAGWITNWFDYMRHEVNRQPQRSDCKKMLIILRILIPGYSTLSWHLEWLKSPTSWSAEYWVSVMKLFQCTLGDLPQAILQTYLILHFWWDNTIDSLDFYLILALASLCVSMAVCSVVCYIRKEYFEEEHDKLKITDFLVIVIATMLNLGGRVVSLAMVGNVYKVSWMAGGSAFILITNYTMSLKMYVDGNKIMSWPRMLFYPIPIAFLYALSMTRKRGLMMVNTFFWLLLSLPQIAMYNKKLAQWGLFLGPFLAQVLALVLLLWKWEVVEVAFRRFERLLKKV